MAAVRSAHDNIGSNADVRELLFDAFGYPPPRFQLISQGDAENAPDFTECRRLGIVPQVLFQELARMVCGSAPVEKMRSLAEWIRLYHARTDGVGFRRFDKERLLKMNHLYLSQLPQEDFIRLAAPYAGERGRTARFIESAKKMQSATTLLSEAANWR